MERYVPEYTKYTYECALVNLYTKIGDAEGTLVNSCVKGDYITLS